MKNFLLIIGFSVLALLLVIGGFAAHLFFKKREFAALANSPDLNTAIEKMAGEYVTRKPHAAVTIGVIQNGKIWTKGFGTVPGTKTPPNAKSIYEIGSITKVFTGVLLSSLKQQGIVSTDDTISSILPKQGQLPGDAGTKINLRHLATHTAGLPRLPDNLFQTAKDPNNPYKDYTAAHLYQAMAKMKPENPPGKKSSYSNLGAGLLGHLLELKSRKTYNQLIHEYITRPLNMSDTKLELSSADKSRLVPGRSAKGAPAANWDFQVLAPAGGIKSTVADLLLFIKANLEPQGPIGKALEDSRKIRFNGPSGTVGLGWHILKTAEGSSFWWHNGGTAGYATFLGLDLKTKTGIVILSNSGDAFARDSSIDKMAIEILKLANKVSLSSNTLEKAQL